MTKSQIKKLETILGKLENLQNEIVDQSIKEQLGYGKTELLRALRLTDK